MNTATVSIGTEHKAKIEEIRKAMGHTLSSHAFVSLYLWQQEMGLSLRLGEDFFTVKCALRGENAWFFPCGSENGAEAFIENNINCEEFSLCYLRSCDADWLESRFPGRFALEREEAADEYICNISEYVALEGSRFAELRKRIRHIKRLYEVKSRPISDATVGDAMTILKQWHSLPHSAASDGLTDEKIGETALLERGELCIDGNILYLDGKPMALFAGFPLSDDTIDALIGKCAPDAPNYTVYLAMHEYLKNYEGKTLYCNLEEDLGINGIRMVKRKMNPVGKNEIWKAVAR